MSERTIVAVFVALQVGCTAQPPTASPDSPVARDAQDAAPVSRMDRFHAGDDLVATRTPYPLTADAATWLDAYLRDATPYRAFAVSEDGHGYAAAFRPLLQSDAEAERIALEGCQIYSGDQPCAVFALGNRIKYDETAFHANMKKLLATGPRRLDPATVPTLREGFRTGAIPFTYSDSAKASPFAALALNFRAGWGVGGTSETSQADADRQALERCEGGTLQPCTLSAEGEPILGRRPRHSTAA